jgi:hypothetical protein
VKGLLADLLDAELAGHESYAIDSAGDVRVGGSAGLVLAVIHATPNGLSWLVPVLVVGGGAAAVALVAGRTPRVRHAALAAVLALLLVAPGAWAVQTLGHATSGTFPAGGPADAMFGGGGSGGPAVPAAWAARPG